MRYISAKSRVRGTLRLHSTDELNVPAYRGQRLGYGGENLHDPSQVDHAILRVEGSQYLPGTVVIQQSRVRCAGYDMIWNCSESDSLVM